MLSGREVLLVLRARDEASRVMHGLSRTMAAMDGQALAAAQAHITKGAALMSVGVAIGAAGAAGLLFFGQAAAAASEYYQQVGKTLTQTDNVKTSFGELAAIGKEVAAEIPAPFEEMQQGLYDIFSSMDVNVPEARMLLEAFATAAVAGSVSIEKAGRASIAIMNAYQKPASEINAVNDVMFQLVRKGVGTYEEFAGSIGQAIPAAVRAGQEFETLAGMMAFLTRNGLSTSMAATSAARALELMSKPQVAENMAEIGIAVHDAKGEFRPLIDIMGDLNERLGDMTAPERAAALDELFKGQGWSIQARRFFDTAITGYDQLGARIDDMHNASGAAKEAYDIMFKQPQNQVQLLKNNFQVLFVTLGEALIPGILKLTQAGIKVLTWLNDLSPEVKRNIAIFGVLASGILVVVGIIVAAAGAFLMLYGAALTLGITIGTLAGIAAGVVVALVALVAAGILIYKNWDTIKERLGAAWEWIQAKAKAFVEAFIRLFGPAIGEFVQPMINAIMRFKDSMVDLWNEVIKSEVVKFFGKVKLAWSQLVDKVQDALKSLAPLWDDVQQAAIKVADWFLTFGKIVLAEVQKVVRVIVGTLLPVFRRIGDIVSVVFDVIGDVFSSIVKIFKGIIQIITGVINGDWKQVWEGAKNIVKGIWDAIVSVFSGAWDLLRNIVMGIVEGIIGFFTNLWNVLVGNSIIPDMIMAIIEWFLKLPVELLKLIGNLVKDVVEWFVKMAARTLAKLIEWVGNVIQWVTGLPGKAWDALKEFASKIVERFQEAWNAAWEIAKEIWNSIIGWILGLPLAAWNALVDLAAKLASRAVEAWNAFWTAAKNKWTETIAWIGSLPAAAFAKLAGIVNSLRTRGIELITGLWNGAKEKFVEVASWLAGRGAAITSLVGSLAGALWNAGWSIMSGFWQGMKDRFYGWIADWLSSLAGIIAGLKGPPAYDAVVLQDNGRLIMEGFLIGLQDGWKDVESYLKSRSAEIAGSIDISTNTGFGDPRFGPGPDGGNPGIRDRIYAPVSVTVQDKDDAVAVGQRLGFDLERRFGD